MMVQQNQNRGFALVATLWALMLLAIIAAALAQNSRSSLYLARNQNENAHAAALADAGIYIAIAEMNTEGGSRGWSPDGTEYRLGLAGGYVDISIQDEGGKIDLNAGRPPHLESLLRSLGASAEEAQAITDAIIDYRDGDDRPRQNGAEDREYQAAGIAWGSKDAPFEHVAELRQVLGMTVELFQRLTPFVTVFSGRAGVDPRSAPLEVLSSIPSMMEESALAIIAERDSADDEPFPDRDISVNDTVDRRYFRRSQGLMLSIRSEARTASGASFVREAVVALHRDAATPSRILSWRRGEPK